jgi:predicted nucleic acid-binding protein
MSDRVFFDTNVLVYLFDTDSPAKQARNGDLTIENPFAE